MRQTHDALLASHKRPEYTVVWLECSALRSRVQRRSLSVQPITNHCTGSSNDLIAYQLANQLANQHLLQYSRFRDTGLFHDMFGCFTICLCYSPDLDECTGTTAHMGQATPALRYEPTFRFSETPALLVPKLKTASLLPVCVRPTRLVVCGGFGFLRP